MFQIPLAIIPPRMNLEAFLLEPYINYGLMDMAGAKEDIRKWIRHVDLPETIIWKYPHEVSGGQPATCCTGANHADEAETGTL